MIRWTRAALAARVDALAEEQSGPALVESVQRLAAELRDDEREVLGQVLLERARREGAFDDAVMERVEARGWLRRQWAAAERRRPR